MDPPVERADGDTDRDSDDSDEPTGLVTHLPRRLLGSQAQMRKRKRAPLNRTSLEADSDDEDDEPPENPGRWSKVDPKLVGSRIPTFIKVDKSAEDRELLEGLCTALDYYKLFQPDSFVQQVGKNKL